MDIYVSILNVCTCGGMAEKFEPEIVYVGSDYDEAKESLLERLSKNGADYAEITVWRYGKKIENLPVSLDI